MGFVSPIIEARVRRKFMLTVALCGSCESSDDAFLETTYVRYVTEQPFAPCGGLAADTDLKIEHLFDRIGEPYPSKRSITYKWVANNQSLVCLDYAAGCTRMEGEEPIVAALDLAQTHELAHATHFLALGWGNRLLAEGFATYLANQPPALSAESLSSFATDIELMIAQGTVATEKQYALAAQFVGVTMERHGIEDFKDFWRNVDGTTTLEAFRMAYETQYGEPWAQALSAIAAGQQSTYTDIGCRGEAQVVGTEGLSLTFAQTCEDDGVLGPVWRNGVIAGEVPIPVQFDEGLYRFSFTSKGAVDEPAAHFRGCHEGTTAPQVPVGLFFPGEDSVLFLGAGRYLLSVRVPLTQDDARDAIAMKITPQM